MGEKYGPIFHEIIQSSRQEKLLRRTMVQISSESDVTVKKWPLGQIGKVGCLKSSYVLGSNPRGATKFTKRC